MVTKSLTIRFSDTPQPNTHSNSGCRALTYYFRLLNLRLISIEYNITVSHTNAKTNNCKEPTCSEGNLRNCHITFFHLLIDVQPHHSLLYHWNLGPVKMVNIWDFPYKNLKYITNNTNKLHSGQMPAQSQQKRQKKQNHKCCPSVLTFDFELTFFVKPNSVWNEKIK